MLWLLTFVVSLPSGLDYIALLILGVLPAVIGAALLWAGYRGSKKGRSPEVERLTSVKDQIVWRAIASGGRITAAEAATFAGLTEIEVEHALMSLVAEGKAVAEPGGTSGIVYRIDSPHGSGA